MTYIPALSGLRAVACIAVVLFHSKVAWSGGGYLGVDVFFVLSGYLTVSILNRGDVGLGDVATFIERRVMRILPLLVAVVLSVGLVVFLLIDSHAALREIVSPLGLFSNVALATGGGPEYLGHSWSVSSEMQFYLAIALLFAAVSTQARHILLPLFLVIFATITGLRFTAFYDGQVWSSIYFSPVLRVSGLFLGGAAALVPRDIAHRLAPLGVLGFCVILMAFFMAVHLSAISFTIWSTAVEVASALLIISLVSTPNSAVSKILSGKRIEVLGLWSYGIYLWHYPVARVLREITTPEVTAIATLVITIPLSAFTYRLVEQRYRFMRISDVVLVRRGKACRDVYRASS